ncbi:MAG: hypothetical protein PVG33_16310, partial [Chloroflexota bacterium]
MQLSERYPMTTWDYWRVILALAAKDIVDAIKNKTTLTMLLGLSMLIFTVQAMPLMLKLDDRPRVAIYDAARSGLADQLRRQRGLQVYEMRSAEDARDMAVEASGPLLALTLPADWQSAAGPLQLQGYLAHWAGPDFAGQLAEVERALAAGIGRPVTIQTQIVYPTLANSGHNV